MLQHLVSRLLSKYLGDFVTRVDGESLDLGLWQGDLVLRELELKQRTFWAFGQNQFVRLEPLAAARRVFLPPSPGLVQRCPARFITAGPGSDLR
jgi:hypothetical protein